MIYLTHEEPRATMNKYALQIRDRWEKTAPTRLRELDDPETYFTELGEMVLNQVDRTATALAGPAPANESYLERVARLSTATRQAEELAMSELDWPPIEEPDPRSEWEATTASEEALAEWAWELQGERPFEDDLQAMSSTWLLPAEFLLQLAAATNPWTFLQEHSETMTTSRDLRFQRDQLQ